MHYCERLHSLLANHCHLAQRQIWFIFSFISPLISTVRKTLWVKRSVMMFKSAPDTGHAGDVVINKTISHLQYLQLRSVPALYYIYIYICQTILSKVTYSGSSVLLFAEEMWLYIFSFFSLPPQLGSACIYSHFLRDVTSPQTPYHDNLFLKPLTRFADKY